MALNWFIVMRNIFYKCCKTTETAPNNLHIKRNRIQKPFCVVGRRMELELNTDTSGHRVHGLKEGRWRTSKEGSKKGWKVGLKQKRKKGFKQYI